MGINTVESLSKTENKAQLYCKKNCWKIAIFFAQRAGAPKFTVYGIKDTSVNGVVISFMTLPADGLISLILCYLDFIPAKKIYFSSGEKQWELILHTILTRLKGNGHTASLSA